MKNKLISIILVLLLCLSSCSDNTTGRRINVMMISLEMEIPKMVKKSKVLDVGIGISSYERSFDSATLTINARDFDIILSDGSRYEDYYVFEYMDFSSSKYGFSMDKDGNTRLKYFENVSLVYTGTDDHIGCIYFTLRSDSPSMIDGVQGPFVNVDEVYYEAWRKYIIWDIDRPLNFGYSQGLEK